MPVGDTLIAHVRACFAHIVRRISLLRALHREDQMPRFRHLTKFHPRPNESVNFKPPKSLQLES